MDKTLKVLIIAMAVLVIIVPIGLIATGTAFGEWGTDELQESIGYVPGRAGAALNALEPDPARIMILPVETMIPSRPRHRATMSLPLSGFSSAPESDTWWEKPSSRGPTNPSAGKSSFFISEVRVIRCLFSQNRYVLRDKEDKSPVNFPKKTFADDLPMKIKPEFFYA